jgi:diguanylate cyclase (GGDEF)-like protein/PAS domain S-box-containing protein
MDNRDLSKKVLAQSELNLRAIIDSAPIGIWMVGVNGRYRMVNKTFCDAVGISEEQFLETTCLSDLLGDNIAVNCLKSDCECLEQDVPCTYCEWFLFKDGEKHHLEITKAKLLDSSGQLLGIIGIALDVTKRKRIGDISEESESYFRLMFEQTADALLLLDPKVNRFIDCNRAAALMLGFDGNKSKDWLHIHPGELSPLYQPDGQLSAEKAEVMITNALQNGSHRFEWVHRSDCREDFPVEVLLTPIQIGGQQFIITTWRDITERHQKEVKLKLAANVFTHSREAIIITDAAGIIIEVNEAFTQITGYSQEEALGKDSGELQMGCPSQKSHPELWEVLIEKGHWNGELWTQRKNGEVYAVMCTVSSVNDASDNLQNYVVLFTDITNLKKHQEQLEKAAHYDALTGLPNRILLADRLERAILQAQRRNQLLAVVYLDLDGFKSVNDEYGHNVGDELLIVIAQRMKETLREVDTISRIGGDEFVAVMADLKQMTDCEYYLQRLLQAVADRVTIGDLTLQVSASIGVAFYPKGGDDADLLLRHADQAMYVAKLSGKNRYHVFDNKQGQTLKSQNESVENIRISLERREFAMYYQPKVNMKTGAIIGAEALIRWLHPEQGLLLPNTFLPIIENHPLAIEIDNWVIDAALAQISLWQTMGLDIPISVNIGARQLQQADFVTNLAVHLASYPEVSPKKLELEILETSALEDITQVSELMGACRKLGVRFALDDFGAGYSSLTYLKRLPAHILKVDQSFVRDKIDDLDDLAIIKGIVGLAKAFNREIIAEGVETIAHGTLLISLGCELAQGYVIAKPMPAKDIPSWAETWQPDASWKAKI